MNKITLKLDFQGVNNSDIKATPIDPKATSAILEKWQELAIAVVEKVKLTEKQYFSWYLHIGAGWGDPEEGKSTKGLATVHIMEGPAKGEHISATRGAELHILPERFGMKWYGELTLDQVVEQVIARFNEVRWTIVETTSTKR